MTDRKRVFILGSGFSAQLTQGKFPTSQKLIEQLKKDVPHPVLIRNIQDTFNQPDQIQEILSRLDMDRYVLTNEKEKLKQDIFKNFQKQLSVEKLYEDTGTIESAKKLVKDLFRSGDTLISFNWDVCLEHLICLNFDTKATDYLFDWGQVFSAFHVDPTPSTELSTGVRFDCNNKVIVLKPHGSFNFVPVENKERMGRPCDLRPITDNNTKFFEPNNQPCDGLFFDLNWAKQSEKTLFPGINSTDFQGLVDKNFPEFIMPTFVKDISMPEYLKIWEFTDFAMRNATEIIIIGYRFPPEDYLMWHLLNVSKNSNITIRILGNIDEGIGKDKLRNRLASMKLISRDETHLAPYNPMWFDYYSPINDNWDEAYAKLIKDLN